MMLAQRSAVCARPVQRAAPTRRAVVVKAQKPEDVSPMKAVALPLASMVAAALIAGAVLPEDALAASSRSGGRVGGSSGFQSRRAPPSRSIQTQAAPSVSSTTVVVAPSPPMFSPFGFSPFGGFGGFGLGFGMPVFVSGSIFSSILGLFFVTILASVVFNVIRGIAASASKGKGKDDSWGDL